MAAKSVSQVINPSTRAIESEITATGVWEIAGVAGLRSDLPARVTFKKGSGADPVGSVVSMGIKTGNLTPEAISGASATLTTMASSTVTLPVRVYPDGRLCVVVTTYVAPLKVEVIQ